MKNIKNKIIQKKKEIKKNIRKEKIKSIIYIGLFVYSVGKYIKSTVRE